MTIEQQVQALIDEAPQDGQTPQLMQVLGPVFLQVAQQLSFPAYSLLQRGEGEWLITTLSNRSQPELEKHVIYCYGHAGDVPEEAGAELVTVPIVHLLFQLAAIPAIDALVCFEVQGQPESGVEILRSDIQGLMELQVKRFQAAQIPSDLA